MKIKRYILFVYDRYYAIGGWSDYVDSFNNIDEAKKSIRCIVKHRNANGDLLPIFIYNGIGYSCYQLIDLHKGENVNLFNKPIESYIK